MPVCNICKISAGVFLSYGNPLRNNVWCPNCNSLERHRLIWRYLQSYIRKNKNLKVLHFAPEKCFYEIFKKMDEIDYYMIDFMVETYNYPPGTIQGDIRDIPFEDNFFDLIICSHVLEHIDEDKLAIKELARVLNQNGQAIICVPIAVKSKVTYENNEITDPGLRKIHFGQHNHVRLYGIDFAERLRSEFYVTEYKCREKVTQSEIELFRLTPNTIFHVCRKTP